jgi:hypothetical protein
VTPSLPPVVLDFLSGGDPAASRTVGVVLLALLVLALLNRVLMQSAEPFPRRDILRLLDLITVPLLIVFALVVLERFRDLS